MCRNKLTALRGSKLQWMKNAINSVTNIPMMNPDIVTGVSFMLFFAAVVAAIYSEVMARVRKYPAISYLVVAIFPLIPGAGIYYATSFLLQDNKAAFTEKALQTIGIAGVIAVGILMVSTLVRLQNIFKTKKK